MILEIEHCTMYVTLSGEECGPVICVHCWICCPDAASWEIHNLTVIDDHLVTLAWVGELCFCAIMGLELWFLVSAGTGLFDSMVPRVWIGWGGYDGPCSVLFSPCWNWGFFPGWNGLITFQCIPMGNGASSSNQLQLWWPSFQNALSSQLKAPLYFPLVHHG